MGEWLRLAAPADLVGGAIPLLLVAACLSFAPWRIGRRVGHVVAVAGCLLVLVALGRRAIELDRTPTVFTFERHAIGGLLLTGLALALCGRRATRSPAAVVLLLAAAFLWNSSASAPWTRANFAPALQSAWVWVHPLSFTLATVSATAGAALTMTRHRHAAGALEAAIAFTVLGSVTGLDWVSRTQGDLFTYDAVWGAVVLFLVALLAARGLLLVGASRRVAPFAAVLATVPLLLVFAYEFLPNSHRSPHRFSDDGVVPYEGLSSSSERWASGSLLEQGH